MTSPPAAPLPVADHCWLVGGRHPTSLLQCNTYLRTYEQGSTRQHVCVDPGSRFDLEAVRANIGQLAGDMSQVDAFTLNHQDPDVVGNAPALCEANPRIGALVTEDVWRLVQHLGFRPARMEFVNAARNSRVYGGRLQLVPTPFCHFRGAMAFYDPEIRTLFSGDLFGGLNQLGRVHLFAEEEDWVGIAQFHQIYMPGREILRYAVRQIRALRPAVELIAPQHGHVIVGDRVPAFLDRMYDLLVGHDLLAIELDDAFLGRYREVLAQVVVWADEVMEPTEVRDRLRNATLADGLEKLIRFAGDDVVLEREGYAALVKVFDRLTRGESTEFTHSLRSLVLALCSQFEAPIPPIGVGLEEGGVAD